MQPPVIETETDSNLDLEEVKKPSRRSFWLWFVLFDFLIITPLLVVGGMWYVLQQPPTDFEPQRFTIAQGDSVQTIAQNLQQESIIKSAIFLELVLRYNNNANQILAGDYEFTEPQTVFSVAKHLVSGDILHELVSVTFVEGVRAQEYAQIASQTLPGVTETEFLALSEGLEGRLFPETYFVPDDYSAGDMIALMRDTHDEVVSKYVDQISANNLTLEDAIILASIIEREANTPESMRTVAGIFLNRLSIGMALQADASIEYVIDTPLGELAPGQLATELRELDSPYNTYLYPGLPPTPIGNPGETAIAAIADPIESDYFYYITGNDGEFYYAETYNQHLANIARYLRY